MVDIIIYEDRVLVQPDPLKEKTEGGIFLDNSTKKDKREGTIVATGPGRNHDVTGVFIPMIHSVGDRVRYSQFANDEFEVTDDTNKYLLMRSADIVAKI